MSWRYSTGPNRLVCTVIAELQKLHETRNYAMLPSLLEEMQTMVNRMEAALYNIKDEQSLRDSIKKLKAECVALEAKKNELGGTSAD
jgi:hypothetical protein